ncbi:hypothetical protein WJX74_000188 [Apatococcus lobatus]|uniref:NmrA-like domain-containing protein n=1 Tax=Apatococcus lobatus TaxID=904363 RepID=A0AAW1QLS1_9CHLO
MKSSLGTGPVKRVLVFGATGSFGSKLAECLALEQVCVVAWVRPDTLLGKKERLDKLRIAGVEIIEGDFGSRSQILAALTGVHTVVSCLSGVALTLQLELLGIAKAAGVQRFVPSEYGSSPEMAANDPCMEGSVFMTKQAVRGAVLASGMAWTILAGFTFMHYFLPRLGELSAELQCPPEEVQVFCNGQYKASFVTLENAAALAAKVVLDSRTTNKFIHIRPPGHHLSQPELIHTWTRVSGQGVQQIPVPSLVDSIRGSRGAERARLQFTYYIWERGSQSATIPNDELEACKLYPHVSLVSPSAYLAALCT